jgi:hypothetical protein
MSLLPRKRPSQLLQVVCPLLICLLSGCHENRFESSYVSIGDAVKDGAVARGWVPSFLPVSSRNIHIAGDLSPSRVWCSFEFAPADSDRLQKPLKDLDIFPPQLQNVPGPANPWWPPFLEGQLDLKKIHDAGLQLYLVEEPATASTKAVELFAIDWANGRGFIYGPS